LVNSKGFITKAGPEELGNPEGIVCRLLAAVKDIEDLFLGHKKAEVLGKRDHILKSTVFTMRSLVAKFFEYTGSKPLNEYLKDEIIGFIGGVTDVNDRQLLIQVFSTKGFLSRADIHQWKE
jgi:hypothetical protein